MRSKTSKNNRKFLRLFFCAFMRIKIVLPVFETNADLTEDEKVIYKFLSKTMLKPISEIAPYIPFGKSKTTQLLKAMGEKGVVAIEGKGRGTKYRIK